MIRKLLICPYFGPLPPWWDHYEAQLERLATLGYHFHFDFNTQRFRERVQDLLGVRVPIVEGGSKIHDLRPALGHLYADALRGYDYWGHTDFDCVYGRLHHFIPDERLNSLDVYSDHRSYLCGPWTLYRNTPEIRSLFQATDGWQSLMREPTPWGWVETSFTQTVNEAGLRVLYEQNHGYEHPGSVEWNGDRLLERGREISFFHFRRSKEWPAGLAAAA